MEQIRRLFSECLYNASPRLDTVGRLRVDEKELNPAVQQRVEALWEQVDESNLFELTDFAGYNSEFLKLFGFGVSGIDYDAETNPLVASNF
jgi:enoyl-[acyl-carrier protein] reductase/trans-2-enoyl-CoA reductase (NAD+)